MICMVVKGTRMKTERKSNAAAGGDFSSVGDSKKDTSEIDAYAVSIVLPTYNRAYCLRRAIDSVLNQTFRDFELIVIDDGSTDETKELIESYDDPRIVFLHNLENRGASACLNDGIRVARAPLIAIQDSDDEWLPKKLEKQVATMRAAPEDVGVVYCDRWRIEGAAKVWSRAPHFTPDDGLIYGAALSGSVYNIANQCLLIRRYCFENVGYFDENIRRHLDLELLIRISSKYLFLHIPEALVNYYITNDSISKKGEEISINTWEIIVEKHLGRLKDYPKALAKRSYWIGSYHMRSANTLKGQRYLAIAFRASPTNPRYAAAFLMSLFGSAAYRFLYSRFK